MIEDEYLNLFGERDEELDEEEEEEDRELELESDRGDLLLYLLFSLPLTGGLGGGVGKVHGAVLSSLLPRSSLAAHSANCRALSVVSDLALG